MKAPALNKVTIELLSEDDTPALETFLCHNLGGTFYHTLEWHKVIQATYGHSCEYWVAWSDREIVGIFPVVAVRHPILGTKMVAMPYQLHSGVPLAMSEVIKVELVERAVARAREAGAKYLEIRHHEPAPFLERIGFLPVDSQLVTTVTPLKGLDLKQMRRRYRTEVRYALKRGVRIDEGETLSDLRLFRRMNLLEGRKLGTPQAGWNFFQNLHHFTRSYYHLLLAWSPVRCLGGVLVVGDGRTVFLRYTAYNSPEALKLHVGKALFWRAISDAAERGCQSFNSGISWCRDFGLIHYKEGWNGTTRPVFQYVYPIRSLPPAPGGYFEGFKFAKAVWRRLPLPLVDWAGQRVTRWIC